MRGIRLSKTFKNYVEEQGYNWSVNDRPTDFTGAYIDYVCIRKDKLHNLKLLGKFFKTEDEEYEYAENHSVSFDNGTTSRSYDGFAQLCVIGKDEKCPVCGNHKIMTDGILVKAHKYWSHGLPTVSWMEAPFEDFLAYIEDDIGIKPDDTPTPEFYRHY